MTGTRAPRKECRPLEKQCYYVIIRRSHMPFAVFASSEDAALAAVNAELKRLHLPPVGDHDCIISRAIVLQGE